MHRRTRPARVTNAWMTVLGRVETVREGQSRQEGAWPHGLIVRNTVSIRGTATTATGIHMPKLLASQSRSLGGHALVFRSRIRLCCQRFLHRPRRLTEVNRSLNRIHNATVHGTTRFRHRPMPSMAMLSPQTVMRCLQLHAQPPEPQGPPQQASAMAARTGHTQKHVGSGE